ncbi:putative GABA permease [Microthyrium microscopicum]|uniref:Putative GABA permease n=1 Tax=Microthyrium microscopicum TaxID=703497 RepID=A0A6A6TY47_9PEZI|nr:putative GABA permease [Microthyrium microscopicum]
MTTPIPSQKVFSDMAPPETITSEPHRSGVEPFDATVEDDVDMQRMGKVPELKRRFRYYTTLFFVTVLTATWEYLLIANTTALVDGGRAGFFWSLVWSIAGMTLVTFSLAEMSSMAPTSGGQYHWVSEFAPVRYQKFLSYMSGWLSTMAWQAATASSGTLIGGIIQALISLNNPNYASPPWQLFLLAIAVMLSINLFNIYGGPLLAPMGNPMMFLHVALFVVIIAIFWALGPTVSAREVFVELSNTGGWSSIGLALCVGQVSAIFGLMFGDADHSLKFETSAHMSEEVQDAAVSVPKSMVYSFVINSFMGLVLVVSYLFALPSVDDAVAESSGFAFLYVFQQAMPVKGVNAVTALLVIVLYWSCTTFNSSASRETWSFARDKGLPFSNWIGHVDVKRQIPTNAIWLSLILSCLMNMIVLGSTAAFNALISLQVVALMATYIISISCVLWRRICLPETLPLCRWSLGRWGIVVNGLSLCYTAFAFFWCFWPQGTPVELDSVNWSPVMFVGVMVVSVVLFAVQGRKVYEGPVVSVESYKRDATRSIEGVMPKEEVNMTEKTL